MGLLHNGSHFLNLFEFLFGKTQSFKVIDSGKKINQNDSEPFFVVEYTGVKIYFTPIWKEIGSYFSFKLFAKNGILTWDYDNVITWDKINKKQNQKKLIISNNLHKYQLNVFSQIVN